MDLFGISPELFSSVLSQAAQASLTEKLIVAGIIWSVVSKKFTKHFERIELSLTALAKHLGELNESIVRIEKQHSGRIEHLEDRVDSLENK